MKLSERLTLLRKQKGVTLETASRAVKCSFQHLCKLEKDKAYRPKMQLLENLCAYYEISQDILIIEAGKIPADVYWKVVNNPQLLKIIREYRL
jgi:transcriptional regulator with XRE-family HTH domain